MEHARASAEHVNEREARKKQYTHIREPAHFALAVNK